jgi:hypothetical protein
VDKHGQTRLVLNSKSHLTAMKRFVRDGSSGADWGCRAGKYSCVIRMDGTLAPCFEQYLGTMDCGRIGSPRFDQDALNKLKRECTKHCLSTCNFNVSHYSGHFYNAVKWLLVHGY